MIEKADHVTPSLDEFLYINNLPRAMSYPKTVSAASSWATLMRMW
ncbi:hypothetical protein [Chitinophaga sedimenti]|nr:hypothetical protein [Chitinophaga sedimenti]